MSRRPTTVIWRLVFAATVAMGLVGGQAARAAVVETRASLDWSGFAWSFTGTALNWSNFSDDVVAQVDLVGDSDFESNWTTGTSATATNPMGTATARTEPTNVPNAGPPSGELAADISADPQFGFARATRSASVEAVGSGTVRFSIPYALDVGFSDEAVTTLFASTFVQLDVFDVDSGFFQATSAALFNSPSGTPGGDMLSRAGPLVLELNFSDGDFLYFSAVTRTSVAVTGVVPVPATVWLFFSALLTFGFIRKVEANGWRRCDDAGA